MRRRLVVTSTIDAYKHGGMISPMKTLKTTHFVITVRSNECNVFAATQGSIVIIAHVAVILFYFHMMANGVYDVPIMFCQVNLS